MRKNTKIIMNFEESEGLFNEIHQAKPAGKNYTCPVWE
jgi:hypothetical protein